MTQYQTYCEYEAVMTDIRKRKNRGIADNDKQSQRLYVNEALRVISANPKWGTADRAWAGRIQDDDDDFDGD
jgi:hypothetical protein